MEFGSDYVYHYDEDSYENVSDQEFEMGLESDSDTDTDDEWDEPVQSSQETRYQAAPEPAPAPVHAAAPAKSFFGGLFSFKKREHVPPQEESEANCKKLESGEPAPPRAVTKGSVSEPVSGKNMAKQKRNKSHWKVEDCLAGKKARTSNKERFSRKYTSAFSIHDEASYSEERPSRFAAGKRMRQADTNVISVKLNKLVAPSNMHAGDPHPCQKCSAILSKISKVVKEGEDRIWVCEFCGERNNVDVVEEEIPQTDDITFMLEPALSTTASGPSGNDVSLVVFCIDISGSMCVSTEVQGHIDLRGAESLRRLQSMNTDRSNQFLPRQRRDVTYISRLQSVQAAIDHQLEEMTKTFPNRRVALITFNSEVTVIGDGKGEPVVITGDKLKDAEKLKTIAAELAMPDSIKTTRQALGEKLFDLEEGGPTALGPALQIATTMASTVPGSKVILCTDGMANVGMGKLSDFASEEEETSSLGFYEEIGTYAKEKGVSVSVITIKGTDCKLVYLGRLAEKTGGQVNIVDPLKLTQQFSTILANKILATNVVATFILHKDLYFLYEDTEDSKVERKIGNVTADTEISFEYGVRTKPKEKKEKETTEEMDRSETGDKVEGVGQAEGEGQAEGVGQAEASKGLAEVDREPVASGSGEPVASGSGELVASGSSQSAGDTEKQTTVEEEVKEIPFQLQIVYTDTEGAKAMLLLTKTKPVTRDRKKAERKINLDVIGKRAQALSAQMALDGCYTQARGQAMMKHRMAWRYTKTDEGAKEKEVFKKMFGKVRSVENRLAEAQQRERSSRGGTTYSDDEDEIPEPHVLKCKGPKSKSMLSRFQKKKRLNEMSDEVADDLYELL